MKILAVGDLVGENGLDKLKQVLPKLKEEAQIDFVIVNAENVAGGMGITFKNWNDLLKLPIDVVTMGNHTWGKKDIFGFIDDKILIRPANYVSKVPGKGYGIYECKGKKICVVNLIGRTDMNVQSENPFTRMQSILEKVKDKGYKILYLTDNVDEFVLQVVMEYEGKKFVNVCADNLNLDTEEEKEDVLSKI